MREAEQQYMSTADRDQNQILNLDNNHTGENVNFQTPSARPDAVVQSSRPRLSGKRLANAFSAPLNEDDRITRADHDLSTDDDLPLASSQLRGVQQPLQPLRETVPSALTQSKPDAPASFPGSVGQISSALTVQTPQSVQQVHFSAASAAAVTSPAQGHG